LAQAIVIQQSISVNLRIDGTAPGACSVMDDQEDDDLGLPRTLEEDAPPKVIVRRVPKRDAGPGGGRKLTLESPIRNPGEKTWEIGEKLQKDLDGEDDDVAPLIHPAQEIQTPGRVVSVWGAASTDLDRFKPCLARKPMNFEGDFSTMRHSVGVMSHRGLKPDSPNQDDFFILSRPERLLVGVLDGHGPDGHDVSHFGQENLPKLLVEHLRAQLEGDWSEAVTSVFAKLVAQAKQDIPDKAQRSGSTVSMLSLDQQDGREDNPLRLRGAFVGDSSMVHAWKPQGGQWEWEMLTNIHKPDRPDEAARIAAAGGKVQPASSKDTTARLMTPEWNLAMSRSFGDFHASPYGLSSVPEVIKERTLDASCEHLILLCSDGVWDVIPPGQAVNLVGRYRPGEAQKAAEKLVSKAEIRWQETEDVVDDITVILIRPVLDPQ